MPAPTTQNRKFLIFTLQGVRYALDLAQVAEVADPPQLSPIPLAPACYSGALNFHGDIVAVIDLALFLSLDGASLPEKVVILHQKIASLAFSVGTVVRIASEEAISFRAAADTAFASDMLCLPDGEAILLNLEALVLEAEMCIERR